MKKTSLIVALFALASCMCSYAAFASQKHLAKSAAGSSAAVAGAPTTALMTDWSGYVAARQYAAR